MSRATTKATKVIKYGGQLFSVRNHPIKEIKIEIEGTRSIMRVDYKGGRFSDYAFTVNHKEGKCDYSEISNLYVSIMALNEQLLNEKEQGSLFI